MEILMKGVPLEHQGKDNIAPKHKASLCCEFAGEQLPSCQLPLWHLPQPVGTLPENRLTGYVSANGHFFECTHGSTGGGALCHTIFIIDRSGSMASTDVRPSNPQITNAAGFSRALDNKLGVVYEAMLNYTNIRHTNSPGDLVSFISFDTQAAAEFSNLSAAEDLLPYILSVDPRGGTHFTCGLHAAFELIRNARANQQNAAHTPVFILLTDSGAHDRHATLSFLRQTMQSEIHRPDAVKLHALGFGQGVDANFMSEIANLGNGSYHTITQTDDVGR